MVSSAFSSELCADESGFGWQQLLVRFENQTHVVTVPAVRMNEDETLSSSLSLTTCRDRDIIQALWQSVCSKKQSDNTYLNKTIASSSVSFSSRLVVTHFQPPFCAVRVASRILGGKGGFGTLLKGQSRQAGAKTTTDFGACRDLQGRRLRHVNDQLALQQFQAWQEKIQRGEATEEDMVRSLVGRGEDNGGRSGVVGWHLQLPTWTRIPKQEGRRVQQQFRRWQRERNEKEAARKRQREAEERKVQSYLDAAKRVSEKVQQGIQAALSEGLATVAAAEEERKAKRSRLETDQPSSAVVETPASLPPEPPAALVTLSGDVVLAQEDALWKMQGQSNFCTMGIILEQQEHQAKTTKQSENRLYFEIGVESGGVIQVGWAKPKSFQPDSETGDGVGDDAHSWAFDGSRQIKLHGGGEESGQSSYGKAWNEKSVVGCLYDGCTGEIVYYLNGENLGTAFHVEKKSDPNETIELFPAISCNQGEVVALRLNESDQLYRPLHCIAVGNKMATEVTREEDVHTKDEYETAQTNNTLPPDYASEKQLATEPKTSLNTAVADEAAGASTSNEPIDLNAIQSCEELEQFGLERLKTALQTRGLKCGGTLQQRAVRLFSVKGIDPKDYPPKLLAKNMERQI